MVGWMSSSIIVDWLLPLWYLFLSVAIATVFEHVRLLPFAALLLPALGFGGGSPHAVPPKARVQLVCRLLITGFRFRDHGSFLPLATSCSQF